MYGCSDDEYIRKESILGMKKVAFSESIVIESDIPIKSLLRMEIKQQLNDHGKLHFHVIIENDKQREFLDKYEVGGQVRIYDMRQDSNSFLFCGRVESIVCEQKADMMVADINAICYSADLDRGRRNRTFQSPNVTFEGLVDQIVKDSGANFMWQVADRKTGQPFIQQETDWEFLVRLASRFNRPIQGSMFSEYPVFYFGIREGRDRTRTFDEAKIMEYGFSSDYYHKGGYVSGKKHEEYHYLKVKHLESWEIGDTIQFERREYTVVDRVMRFDEAGEFYYVDTLGREGFLHRPTVYNEELVGLQLEGTVEHAENESVFVRFGGEDEVNYPWKWVPEVGNLCYIMPEGGSRVILTLPTHDEKDGIVTHVLRRNGSYPSENHQGLSTPHGKHLRLYPDQVAFEAEDSAIFSMIDDRGIQINSSKGISLNAQGPITLSGEQVFVQAPDRILMQTSESNIEMCKNFNFYAPGGVKNSTGAGGGEIEKQEKSNSGDKPRKEDPNHWQASYAALGAVTSGHSGPIDDDAIIRRYALGCVPKICGGHAVVTMSEIMAGTPVEETTFPEAILTLESYTFNGGYRLPIEEGD